jgi:hypothetical protein
MLADLERGLEIVRGAHEVVPAWRVKNGGSIENAAAMANHASTRTTQLYDRRRDEMSLDEVDGFRSKGVPESALCECSALARTTPHHKMFNRSFAIAHTRRRSHPCGLQPSRKNDSSSSSPAERFAASPPCWLGRSRKTGALPAGGLDRHRSDHADPAH